jgi:hypothetical protein
MKVRIPLIPLMMSLSMILWMNLTPIPTDDIGIFGPSMEDDE